MRRLALAALVATLQLPVHAGGLEWSAVPGAGLTQIDLGTVRVQRSLVSAWIRHAGSLRAWGGLDVEPAGQQAAQRRNVLLVEFDCQRRTARTLASQAFDGRGTALFMSSVAGPTLPLPADADLQWTYDAVCDLARSRADAR